MTEYAYSRKESDISDETSMSTILPGNSPGLGPTTFFLLFAFALFEESAFAMGVILPMKGEITGD
jgi:hypothetical protein